MIAEITAIVGILSTLSALWISMSDHRQRATEAHERIQAEAERRIAERDAERLRAEEAAKEAERQRVEAEAEAERVRVEAEAEAERRRERAEAERMWQLNKLVIRLRTDSPGPVWSVLVRNPSGLPILDVQGFWRGAALAEPVDVQGDAHVEIPGPVGAGTPRLAELSVQLSDAQRHRWRQDLDGRVWSGTLVEGGSGYAWTPAALRWGPAWEPAPQATPAVPPVPAVPAVPPVPALPGSAYPGLTPVSPAPVPTAPAGPPRPVCPKGHPSEATDYCDYCGRLMTGQPVSPQPQPQPQLPQAQQPQQPVAPRDGQPVCPVCRTPKAGEYCEACGYDFELPARHHQAGPPPPVPAQGAGLPANPWGEVAQAAAPDPGPVPAGYGGLPPVMPAPAMWIEAASERRPRLRPVLLALWLLSVACFVVLLVVR